MRECIEASSLACEQVKVTVNSGGQKGPWSEITTATVPA
jgi:hypothetical protein